MKPRNDRIKLNTKHWLARGLQYWYPSPEGTGVWHGYSLSRRKSLPLVSGSSPMVPTIHGNNAIDFSSGSSIFTETDYTGFYEKTALTIGFWFKTGTAKADNVGLTLQGGGSGASLLCYTVESTGPRIYWAGTIIDPVVSGLDDNDWHHYVFTTYSSTNNNASMDRHELYIDGVSVGSDTTVKSTGPGGYFEVGLEVGHYNNGAQTFNGQLKDITIHDIALTSEQVWDWYTNERWSLYAEKPRFALADPLPQTRSLTVPVFEKQSSHGYTVDFTKIRKVFPVAASTFLGHGPLATYDGNELSSVSGKLSISTDANCPLLFLNPYVVGRFGNAQFSEVVVQTTHGGTQADSFVGAAVFIGGDGGVSVDRDNHYALLTTNYSAGATTWKLYRRRANNYTQRGSDITGQPSTEAPNSVVARLEAIDTGSSVLLRCFINGVEVLSFTDSTDEVTHLTTVSGLFGTAPGTAWGEAGSADTTRHILSMRAGNLPEREEHSNLQVPIEYEELTFDADAPEGLYFIPQKWDRQP